MAEGLKILIGTGIILLFNIYANTQAQNLSGSDNPSIGPELLTSLWDTTAAERVVSPVADPDVFYDPYRDVQRVQSGVFAAPRHFGVETTYRFPESLTYTNFFLGVINPRGTNSFWDAALSLGREFRLNAYRQQSNHRKTEYYFRVGPGLGIAGRGTIRQSDTDYFLGLNSSAIVGAQYHFNEKTSIYLNGGGRIFWFPGLDDVGFYSVPVISIGLQFSSNPQVPPVRY